MCYARGRRLCRLDLGVEQLVMGWNDQMRGYEQDFQRSCSPSANDARSNVAPEDAHSGQPQEAALRAPAAVDGGPCAPAQRQPAATLAPRRSRPSAQDDAAVRASALTDSAVAQAVRSYLEWWARGRLGELGEMYDEIVEAHRSGFPWQLAVQALAAVDKRRLYRAFDDEELQDLYDLACSADLSEAANRFVEACHARPYVDDGRIPAEVKRLVMERDGRVCQDCGATEDLTIDHKMVPWVNGGTSKDPANLQVLCRSCNSRKGTRPWPAYTKIP